MKKYWPLIVVVLLSISGGAVLVNSSINRSFMSFMVNFSGLFFLFLSCLKFWDLNGFVEGFVKYDLLAARVRLYGYIYPFLELFIALSFLAHFFLPGVAIFTVILMTFGAVGVFSALSKGLDLKCACMGTKLNLPLSSVTIVENVGMGIMAVFIAISAF